MGSSPTASSVEDRFGKAFVPEKTFSEEKLRGIATSIASGSTAGGLNFGLTAAGLSPTLSAFLALYLTGSVLGYVFDILFAKRDFNVPWGYHRLPHDKKEDDAIVPYKGPVPYTDFALRGAWLLRSFVSKQFFRYIITVILDTLAGIIILTAAIQYMNAKEFLVDFEFRDALVAGGISIFTFLLYNNILRFDWAYSDTNDPYLNVIILMWCVLVILIFAVTFHRGDKQSGSRAPSPTDGSSSSSGPKGEDNKDDEDENEKTDTTPRGGGGGPVFTTRLNATEHMKRSPRS